MKFVMKAFEALALNNSRAYLIEKTNFKTTLSRWARHIKVRIFILWRERVNLVEINAEIQLKFKEMLCIFKVKLPIQIR